MHWARRAAVFVAAWGNHGFHRERSAQVMSMLTAAGVRPLCLGLNAAGGPEHPLYVAANRPLRPLPTR